MPSFSATSQAQLNTLHPLLQAVMKRAILIVDFAIVQGHRGEAEQNAAFDKGNSKLRYPNSKHNPYPSLAVDIIPYPTKYADIEAFVLIAGVVRTIGWEMGVGIRWGGDWDGDWQTKDEKFRDYGHFELVEGVWLP